MTSALQGVAAAAGWLAFIAWSVSFYPQVYQNWKRKSVVGLNLSYLQYNIIGFTCYTLYSCLMFWDPTIQQEYHDANGDGSIPVEPNDVAFAIHAVVFVSVQIFQCFIYYRGTQKVSLICHIISALAILYFVLVVIMGLAGVYNYYQMIVLISFVKLAMSFVKYVPQAYQNFQRKSTVGWNVHNVLLDLTGGTLTVLQQILLAVDENDANQVWGNPAKFFLGLESIFFDLVFIVQHYLLYTDRTDRDAAAAAAAKAEAAANGESSALLSQRN
jgi:LCT (Lysosomal Cystine Transporter) family transporter